jgi:hypothetical protein
MDATPGKTGQSRKSNGPGVQLHMAQLMRLLTRNEAEPMMTRLVIATVTVAFLGCGPVYAQVGAIGPTSPLGMGPGSPIGATGPSSPLGMTSPLGIGPSSPVGPVGIPMGSTELATPGESPAMSGASPMVSSGPSTSSPGGIGSPSSVGRAGIPLGATELSPGGLSPP